MRLAWAHHGVLNPEGVNTGNPLERTTCPISLSELDKLYWGDALDSIEITAYLNQRYSGRWKSTNILKWLKYTSKGLRDHSHAGHIRAKKYPEKYKELIANAREASCSSEKVKARCRELSKKYQPLASRAIARNSLARRVQLVCTWCGCKYYRPPSQSMRGALPFHSHSCSKRYYDRERKFAKLRAAHLDFQAKREAEARAWRDEHFPESNA